MDPERRQTPSCAIEGTKKKRAQNICQNPTFAAVKEEILGGGKKKKDIAKRLQPAKGQTFQGGTAGVRRRV